MSFREDLTYMINKHSKENGSDTPDFLLAEYLENCLNVFDQIIIKRKTWYGHEKSTTPFVLENQLNETV